MKFRKLAIFPIVLAVHFAVFFAGPGLSAQEEKKEDVEKKVRVRTEEIVVTAPALQDRSLASTSVITTTTLARLTPRNLSEVLSFASGTAGFRVRLEPKDR